MALVTTTVLFKDYVDTGQVPLDTFIYQSSTLDPEQLQDGDVLVELLYLSIDPYLRFRMKSSSAPTGGFEPGQPLSSGGVGIIRDSKCDAFEAGDAVSGTLPWSSFSILNKEAQASLKKVDPKLIGKVPLSYFLGVLGMPGMTAYAGLKKIAEPKSGEVAFVSAAAGAVGQVVGQLLKHVYGCHVIGSAGSDEKVQLLKDLGFNHAFNYKTTDTAAALAAALAAAASGGIDIYFDNVGGATLDAALNAAAPHARFVLCGGISQYELPLSERYRLQNIMQVIVKRIRLQGIVVYDHYTELGGEFASDMAEYVQSGKVRAVEHVTVGIENAGAAFVDMMGGGNVGKAVVQVCKQDPYLVDHLGGI